MGEPNGSAMRLRVRGLLSEALFLLVRLIGRVKRGRSLRRLYGRRSLEWGVLCVAIAGAMAKRSRLCVEGALSVLYLLWRIWGEQTTSQALRALREGERAINGLV